MIQKLQRIGVHAIEKELVYSKTIDEGLIAALAMI
jgi:hypothetical protein